MISALQKPLLIKRKFLYEATPTTIDHFSQTEPLSTPTQYPISNNKKENSKRSRSSPNKSKRSNKKVKLILMIFVTTMMTYLEKTIILFTITSADLCSKSPKYWQPYQCS